jgi:ketosteroid isomerase-like protein
MRWYDAAVSISSDRIEECLRLVYEAFNERDIDAALALMHADVDWPNAWEGGRVSGRTAVAEYWRRQFRSISSKVEPMRFEHGPDSEVTVLVHQIVDDAKSGERLSEQLVRHRYRFEDGLIVRMDVIEQPASDPGGG